MAVDAQTGAMHPLVPHDFKFPGSIAWLRDGSGLLMNAHATQGIGGQIWLATPGPNPTVRQITNDLFDYRTVTVSRDGKTIIAVASDTNAAIWKTAIDATTPAVKLSDGRYDGSGGVALAPDGSVVYASFDNAKWNILSVDDARSKRLVGDNEFGALGPVVSHDGKTVVFIMFRDQGAVVARMNRDGSDLRVLCPISVPSSQYPAITPDDRWVFFASASDGVARIWKVSIDGGDPQRVTSSDSERPAISPDGKRIAFVVPAGLGVANIDGSEFTRLTGNFSITTMTYVHWTADSKALLHSAGTNDRMNIWLHPLDGSAPRKVTKFDDEIVLRFDVGADGKALVVTRGVLSRDAVVIKNFR